MDQARKLVDENPAISARDALHAAVVAIYDLEGICFFDTDFDRIPNCKRLALSASAKIQSCRNVNSKPK